MSYNSKNVRAVAKKFFQWQKDQTFLKVRSKNLVKVATIGQKEQKETTYIKGVFLQVPPLK